MMGSEEPREDVKPACSECDKVRLEKSLAAEENLRAFNRELEKLSRQQGIDLKKLEEEHAQELDSAEESATTELQKSRWENELGLGKLFHEKITEVSTGGIERSRDSAKYIQTVAAWIATLYGALLALVFSVTENPLPIRGVISAVFLGFAVALAAGYLAFLTKADPIEFSGGGASLTEHQMSRTAYLVQWVNSRVLDRRWAIRASVLSLAVGVAFIPAPFIAKSRPAAIPDAPVAPAIPGAIATRVERPAAKLFVAQIASYKEAASARNEAITKASETSTKTAHQEAKVNTWMLALAGFALLVVIFGPLIWGHFKDEEPVAA